MKLASGHVDLTDIMTFVTENAIQPGGHDKLLQRKYGHLIKQTVSEVPELAGWYIWGAFNDENEWITIYLGKAGNQKTSSLRTRLFDEMREECIAFWASIYGSDEMLNQHMDLYKGKWYKDALRAIRKKQTQHIFWVAGLEPIAETEIEQQEDLLIKLFEPKENIKRREINIRSELTQAIKNRIEHEISKVDSIQESSIDIK